MSLEKPFYCHSEMHGDTAYYATMDEAIKEAEGRMMAPFIVIELIPHPRIIRLTNGTSRANVMSEGGTA